MITGVIAREEHWKTIQALNFRGEHDIRRITAGSPNAAQRELEGNGEYNLLILDIDVFHGNSDIAVSLVERLKKSVPQLQLALIMDGYTSNSLVVRDIKSIGVEEDHIIFGGGAKLKQQINYILHETVQRKENEIDSPEEVKQIPQQLPPAGTITPPSQIDRQSAKSMMIPKQPVRSDIPRAVTIAVAGAGPRMGTTTQAMQILNYLSTMEYTQNRLAEDLRDNEQQVMTIELAKALVEREKDGQEISLSAQQVANVLRPQKAKKTANTPEQKTRGFKLEIELFADFLPESITKKEAIERITEALRQFNEYSGATTGRT